MFKAVQHILYLIQHRNHYLMSRRLVINCAKPLVMDVLSSQYLIWSMFKETQIWERFGLHCGLLHCMQWHSVRHWIVFIPKIKNLRSVYDLITCYCDHFFADVPWQTNTTSTSFAHLNNLTHPYPQCIEYQKWITQAGNLSNLHTK